MTRSRRAILALVLLLPLVALALGGWLLNRELNMPHEAWAGEHVDVLIEPGTSAGSMLGKLHTAGVIRRPDWVRGWLSLRGGAKKLKAGEYRFEKAASPLEVLARLSRGDVLLHTVVIPEGLTLVEIAARFAEGVFVSEEALTTAFRDPASIADLDPLATDLEGYLFPDTYSLPRGTGASKITRTMVEQFRRSVGEDFAQRSSAVGLELREAVVLASMIERETSVPAERPRISRVFHNRLDRGMKMQCDPTVIYALERDGRTVGKLTYRDLEYESAWNTYYTAGLPRGPIANPGRESLLAAVEPADGDELYFVAAPDGGHTFTRTLDDHRKAVREWRNYLRSSR